MKNINKKTNNNLTHWLLLLIFFGLSLSNAYQKTTLCEYVKNGEPCGGKTTLQLSMDLYSPYSTGAFLITEKHEGCYPTFTQWRGQFGSTYIGEYSHLNFKLTNQEYRPSPLQVQWFKAEQPRFMLVQLGSEKYLGSANLITADNIKYTLKCK